MEIEREELTELEKQQHHEFLFNCQVKTMAMTLTERKKLVTMNIEFSISIQDGYVTAVVAAVLCV